MDYNDFSILTDSEYIKLAEEYNNTMQKSNDNKELVNTTFYLIEKCKSLLYINNSKLNSKIKTELNIHLKILTKLSNNLKIKFSPKEINTNTYEEFNLFNYLTNLLEIQNHLNNWLKIENKINLKNFIIDIKNELNNISISLLNILSKLNIVIFKYM